MTEIPEDTAYVVKQGKKNLRVNCKGDEEWLEEAKERGTKIGSLGEIDSEGLFYQDKIPGQRHTDSTFFFTPGSEVPVPVAEANYPALADQFACYDEENQLLNEHELSDGKNIMYSMYD